MPRTVALLFQLFYRNDKIFVNLFFGNTLARILSWWFLDWHRQQKVSRGQNSKSISPLSQLRSPEVRLSGVKGLKPRPDEKRGCHSIVARLAHTLMEPCWGRAPWELTLPRGGMYKPKINYCRGHGNAPKPFYCPLSNHTHSDLNTSTGTQSTFIADHQIQCLAIPTASHKASSFTQHYSVSRTAEQHCNFTL